MNLWPFRKPTPQLVVRLVRTAPRAQRRSRAEREAFEAMCAKLRAENTERDLVRAVANAIGQAEGR